MFETMSSFLWFFIPTLILIVLGIIFEEKLIRVERGVIVGVKQTVEERRASNEPL
ncbi:MAG: hypothetical protein IKN72_03845 [Clostridia bacterium]|nr:hypothetical protein [Clostridia bacterium]